jgi:mRNA interferase HigB
MRIIKRSAIAGYWRVHPDAESPFRQWIETTKAARWLSIQGVRRTFPHADAAKVASGNTVTIFNLGGNKFRLIVSIKYKWGIVYVRDFLTHAEYSKNAWKKRH